jgi:hypothetical protein
MPGRRVVSEPAGTHVADDTSIPGASPADRIGTLREQGADRFDPVALHHVEVLAARAAAHSGSVRRHLDARVAQALDSLEKRFELARCEAAEVVVRASERYPQAAFDLRQFLAAGDFNGLLRFAGDLQGREQLASLAGLIRLLEEHEHGIADADNVAPQRVELKTLRNARQAWSKLSVDKQLARALEQAPKNAGPINSHMLVLRSLALMRDISPDYLNRFMSYVDALLSLDRCGKEAPGISGKSPAGKPRKPAKGRKA